MLMNAVPQVDGNEITQVTFYLWEFIAWVRIGNEIRRFYLICWNFQWSWEIRFHILKNRP